MKDLPATTELGLRWSDRQQAPWADRIRAAAVLDAAIGTEHETRRVRRVDHPCADRAPGRHRRAVARRIGPTARSGCHPAPEGTAILGQGQTEDFRRVRSTRFAPARLGRAPPLAHAPGHRTGDAVPAQVHGSVGGDERGDSRGQIGCAGLLLKHEAAAGAMHLPGSRCRNCRHGRATLTQRGTARRQSSTSSRQARVAL